MLNLCDFADVFDMASDPNGIRTRTTTLKEW